METNDYLSTVSPKDELEIRKEKIINYLKEKKEWIYYLALSIIVYISIFIRTRNISRRRILHCR